jgi:DNA-binding PadR family transcriptional regulator
MRIEIETRRPLSAAVLHILLALSQEAMHGYGIIKEVERQSGRQYRIGPGTLYDNLDKLMTAGLVEDLGAGEEADPRRKYRLTREGAKALRGELVALESVLRLGKKRLRRLKGAEGL